jgi:Domain of unknown function (DUF4440)
MRQLAIWTCFITLFSLLGLKGYGQNAEEAGALRVSAAIFRLEVMGGLDSLDILLDPRLKVAGSDGRIQTKDQYLQRLKGGDFIHNAIEVEEGNALVADNTAIITGKGKFVVTVSGNQTVLHLSYMEVFVRSDPGGAWKLIALKAGPLPN